MGSPAISLRWYQANTVASIAWALAGALTIPDIMAALGSGTGRTSGPLYKKWFDEHAGPLFGLAGRLREESDPRVGEIMEYQLSQESYRPPISGHQCWLFRCAVLHQARGRQDTIETTRLAFIQPGSTATSVHLVGGDERERRHGATGRLGRVLPDDGPGSC